MSPNTAAALDAYRVAATLPVNHPERVEAAAIMDALIEKLTPTEMLEFTSGLGASSH